MITSTSADSPDGTTPDRPTGGTFTLLAHTADLRAVLTAPDRPALYRTAVDFVRAVIVGDQAVRPVETRAVEPEGDAPDERFFRFVRELFYLFDLDGFLPAAVEGDGPWTVRGERLDAARHAWEHHVKAVTRHAYLFDARPDGYHVELVLDL